MQILLAWLEADQEIVKRGRVDIGERHTFREIKRPVSLVWLNNGTAADVAKAKRFADTEGYTVLTYEGEAKPLERARRDIARNA